LGRSFLIDLLVYFPLISCNRKNNMIETVLSKNEISIRLTDERWTHITEEHCELAGMRLEGGDGELLSVREIEKDKFLGCGVS